MATVLVAFGPDGGSELGVAGADAVVGEAEETAALAGVEVAKVIGLLAVVIVLA